VDLQLRVRLNSGRVITGEIGTTTSSYTAIGQQVGMDQRMESVARPVGVMLSESTARLAEHVVLLGEPELVHIKRSSNAGRGSQAIWITAAFLSPRCHPQRTRRHREGREEHFAGRLHRPLADHDTLPSMGYCLPCTSLWAVGPATMLGPRRAAMAALG
jgi:Adenylate and Guanylate cyclase catalytic domain